MILILLQIEHFANVVTHGIFFVPAVFAALTLLWRSQTQPQTWSALSKL